MRSANASSFSSVRFSPGVSRSHNNARTSHTTVYKGGGNTKADLSAMLRYGLNMPDDDNSTA
eukprot:7376051-Prymnesium_polylepis.1